MSRWLLAFVLLAGLIACSGETRGPGGNATLLAVQLEPGPGYVRLSWSDQGDAMGFDIYRQAEDANPIPIK